MEPTPPTWAHRFLQWYCHPSILEEVEGDLQELFDDRIDKQSLFMAHMGYVYDVFRCLRLARLKSYSYSTTPNPNASDMIHTYGKIAWRLSVKHPFYSIVNISGLFAGILFTLLIGMYIWGERQVNQNLLQAEQQYFLTSHWKDPNWGQEITTFAPLAKRLKEEYPHLVANYYRWDGITSIISVGDKHFREGIQLGDSTLLSMYGFELLHGDVHTALQHPFSVVLTAEKALAYFGKTDVVGQRLTIQSFSGNKHDFLISGILKEIPENSVTHLNGDTQSHFFISANAFAFFGRDDFQSWQNAIIPSYIMLQKGVTPTDLARPIAQLIASHTDPQVRDNLTIQPVALTEYYLKKDNGLVKRMLNTLSLVGLFILLMAIINFVNLVIGRSGSRIREIGVRKAIGGVKKQLLLQFLTESFLLVSIATLLALLAYPLAKPLFEQMVGKPILPLSSFPVSFILVPLAIILITGLLAGVYPAFVLSGLHPVDALKGKVKTAREKIWLRKVLVGFQFCLANIVLVGAIIITQQVSYFFSQNLGYEKEYIVTAQVPRDWSPAGVRKMETIRNKFSTLSEIVQATLSYEIPNGNNGMQPLVYPSGSDSTKAVAMQALVSDGNYLRTYQIQLKTGTFFTDQPSDSLSVVLNEKAVLAMGYTSAQQAIGQQIRTSGDPRLFTVTGVVSNFHFGSMQNTIPPMIHFSVNTVPLYRYLSFKLKPGDLSSSLTAIERKWAILLPDSAFEYTYMDQTLQKVYQTEIRLKKAAYLSTILALTIALLGVLGLVAVSVQKRLKEISIRKVLGASSKNIVLIFIQEFILILVVASMLACPLTYILMHSWLESYVYRIDITVWPFVGSLIGLVMLTLLLAGSQVLKAALSNPVDSLRSE